MIVFSFWMFSSLLSLTINKLLLALILRELELLIDLSYDGRLPEVPALPKGHGVQFHVNVVETVIGFAKVECKTDLHELLDRDGIVLGVTLRIR
jgi:hypothetical protein